MSTNALFEVLMRHCISACERGWKSMKKSLEELEEVFMGTQGCEAGSMVALVVEQSSLKGFHPGRRGKVL